MERNQYRLGPIVTCKYFIKLQELSVQRLSLFIGDVKFTQKKGGGGGKDDSTAQNRTQGLQAGFAHA